ncbi:MAG: serine hydrolase domain-containing protein, partial [Gemmatimonadota bacterium]
MKKTGTLTLASAAAVMLAGFGGGGPGPGDRAAMLARIDSIVMAPIKAGKLAGASIAVVRGKDTLVLKGYGLADLELDVPTPPNASYEIGSVTKQFTAVALMQLVEQGKVRLDDDITAYFPGYTSQGNKIPIRRLLDHTSGIKGYTEIPEFRSMQLRRGSRDSLVTLFSAKPFDFPPGEQETYNNSAFFLVGLLIEKVSGMSYADYIKKNLFDPAGMPSSYYCSEHNVRKNHAHGYDTDSSGLTLKAFMNHTWPYAAGSICSTAGDLVAWNQALHKSERLLKRDTYREL